MRDSTLEKARAVWNQSSKDKNFMAIYFHHESSIVDIFGNVQPCLISILASQL